MKRIKNAGYFILFLLPFFLLACNKDETGLSREELLTGRWKLQSQEITSIIYRGQDVPVSFIERLLGRSLPQKVFADSTVITFDEDNSYTISEPASNKTFPGNWSLNDDADILNLTLDTEALNFPSSGDQAVATIEELTENRLTLLLIVEDIEFMDGNKYGGKIRLNFNKE